MKNYILPLLLALSILLLSCQSIATETPKNMGVDFLSNNNCNAPCFYGITPGITSESETKKILDGNSLFVDCTEHDNTQQSGVAWIQCNGDAVGVIFDQNRIVSSVSFRQPNLTVGQVLEKYGIPDVVSVYITSRPDEAFRSSAYIGYDKTLTTFGFDDQKSAIFRISSDLPIVRIAYLTQEVYQQRSDVSIFYSWIGYGEYSAIP